MEDEANVQCVRISKKRAEEARKILLENILLRRDLKPKAVNNDVLFPVTEAKKSIDLLSLKGIKASLCVEFFNKYERKKFGKKAIGITSYTLIGNIALINKGKSNDISIYKKLAKEIVARHPRIRAVYLKLRTSGEYRLPELRHLLGETITETEFKEYGLKFKVDIAKTYVNPRLAQEHRRIAEIVNENEKVLDMFSGIAPFSIHMASLKKIYVLAVDINPFAIYYAAVNIRLNTKMLKGKVIVMKGDARDLPSLLKPVFTRIIMNNPKNSIDFLPHACSLLNKEGYIHVYALLDKDCNFESEIEKRLKNKACEINEIKIKRVREYSRNQDISVADVFVKKITSLKVYNILVQDH